MSATGQGARRHRVTGLLAVGALLLTVVPPVEAHRLRVFAFAEDGRIQGSAYFVGGAPAAGARLRVRDPAGNLLAEPVADAAGEFAFAVAGPVDHRIVADSGDGHQARWTVTAAEAQPGSRPAGDPGDGPPASRAEGAATDLGAVVERAVARQLRPLREQLLACEEQTRFRDVLGGLGYILGLAGLAAWWRRGRAPRAR